MVWFRRLLAALALSSYAGDLVSALPPEPAPLGNWPRAGHNLSNIFAGYPSVLLARQEDQEGQQGQDDDKIELRILPLGASIMSGVGSPENSGSVLACLHWRTRR